MAKQQECSQSQFAMNQTYKFDSWHPNINLKLYNFF